MRQKQSPAAGVVSVVILAAAIGGGMLLSVFTRTANTAIPTSSIAVTSGMDSRPSRPDREDTDSRTPNSKVPQDGQSSGGQPERPGPSSSRPNQSSASSGKRPRGERSPGVWDADKDSTKVTLDSEAPVGGYPGGNPEAVQDGRLTQNKDADINTNPEAFLYYINAKVVLEKPLGSGNICAENPPGNLCPMQIQYFLKGTKDPIYTSAMIWPGECVTEDYLSARLSKGEYEVIAVINVFDPDSLEVKETFQEEIQLIINNKFLGIF